MRRQQRAGPPVLAARLLRLLQRRLTEGLRAIAGVRAAAPGKHQDEDENQPEIADEPKRTFEATGKIKFTSQDHRFLRALKIAVDEENR